MNLGQMKTELNRVVSDVSLQPLMTDWINNAIMEIASDFELPPLKLVDPVEFGVDTTKWLWELPETFHKKLFRAKWVDDDGVSHDIYVCDRIDDLIDKDHTVTADAVAKVAVAVQGLDHYLAIDPLAENTLNLWYYRKPVTLEEDVDVCDCIPPGFERRLIFPKIIIQNYDFIVDQVTDFPFVQGPLQLWESRLAKGEEALKNFFAKVYNKPRRHGGNDPIGPNRRSFRGYR